MVLCASGLDGVCDDCECLYWEDEGDGVAGEGAEVPGGG